MKSRNHIAVFAALILSIFSLSGCFTGIESTPKIGASDVKREHLQAESAEQQLSRLLVPDSIAGWEKGREFKVVDNRIKLLFTSARDAVLPQVDSVIRFEEFMPVISLLGDTVTIARFTPMVGSTDTLSYKIDASPRELMERKAFSIPFVIDLRFVSKVNDILAGKTVYPLTHTRYASDGQRLQRRKFVPVEITGVVPGNTDFPLCVEFREPGDTVTYSLLMSAGYGKMSTRNFSSLFSLTDPRLNYPVITDENWRAITAGKVLPDMTRDECRLSLGSPGDVMHGHSYSSAYERWIYPSGIILEFEDGLLKSYKL